MITLKRIMLLSFTAMFALIVLTQASVPSSYAAMLPRKEAAMSYSNNKILAPISLLGDVKPAVGDGSNDLGTLCRSSKINKFAKYKPVEINKVSPLTKEDIKHTNFGFLNEGIPVYKSPSDLFNAIKSGITAGDNWKRKVPSSCFRLTDFNMYVDNYYLQREWGTLGVVGDKYLNFPFSGTLSFSDDPLYLTSYSTFSCSVDTQPQSDQSDSLIYISDFYDMTKISSSYHDFADWYLGVFLVGNGATKGYILSSSQKLRTHYYSDLTSSFFTTANQPIPPTSYNVYPVMTSLPSENGLFMEISATQVDNSGSSYPGYIALFDGYNFPIRISQSAPNPSQSFSVYFDFGSNGLTITIETGSNNVNIASPMFIYIQSEYLYDNGYDQIYDSLVQEWINTGSTYEDGKYVDNMIVVEYYDCYSAFHKANGNSDIIYANSVISFDVYIPQKDPQGYDYNNNSAISLCLRGKIGNTPWNKYAY